MSERISVNIFKRGNRPYWQMQYLDPDTGRKVRKSTGERTESKARKAAGKWEAEVNEGRDNRKSGRMAWSDFRRLYEDEVLASLADGTDNKASTVFNMIERGIGPKRICDIADANAISRYQTYLRNLGREEPTIEGHLAHLMSSLKWALDQRYIDSLPKVKKPKRVRKSKGMKGRPITTEEFERMLDSVRKVILKQEPPKPKTEWKPDEEKIPTWQYYLRGLWWSGLRLEESMNLHWIDDSLLCPVNLDAKEPMLWIPGRLQKSGEDKLMPLAPEFAEFLRETPECERRGHVFNPRPSRLRYGNRLTPHRVGLIVSAIGKAAGVVVNKTGDKVKYASCHDLRRSFGDRWHYRVLPQILKELMRHYSIQTTLKYYVADNVQRVSREIWDAYQGKPDLGATLGATENVE